jgi:hypothetical protein
VEKPGGRDPKDQRVIREFKDRREFREKWV